MKASDLRKMIRTMVKEELTQLAPVIVEEFLTEKYLKTIVERQVRARPGLSERLTTEPASPEEDEIPEPPESEHLGIYTDRGHSMRNEVVNRLISSSPMSFIYEDVKPIASQTSEGEVSMAEQKFGPGGVPIDKIDGFADRMKQLMNGANKVATARSEVRSQDIASEERRLARIRAELDAQVVAPRPKTQ